MKVPACDAIHATYQTKDRTSATSESNKVTTESNILVGIHRFTDGSRFNACIAISCAHAPSKPSSAFSCLSNCLYLKHIDCCVISERISVPKRHHQRVVSAPFQVRHSVPTAKTVSKRTSMVQNPWKTARVGRSCRWHSLLQAMHAVFEIEIAGTYLQTSPIQIQRSHHAA